MKESTCFFWGRTMPILFSEMRGGWLCRETAGEQARRYIQERCRCARGGVCCRSASKNRASELLLDVKSAEA